MQDNASQTGYLHEAVPGDKTHFCISCNFPINLYARVWPCMHAFCLHCASDMEKCYICEGKIARMERLPPGHVLFISAATLQGFKSEDELAEHALQVRTNIIQSPTLASAAGVGDRRQ